MTLGEAHTHRWRGGRFFLRDDHPWFELRCACGTIREIRAWERYWDPAVEPPAASGADATSGAPSADPSPPP